MFCIHCGAEIKEGDNFCTGCGVALIAGGKKNIKTKRKISLKKKAFVCLIILVLLFFAIAIISYNGSIKN
jgi:predicted nucleic acid-binding Zn ribbon protein